MEGFLPKKRHNLGIIFNFNPDWMGGIVYIINIIKTLDYLDDEDKPEITLFYSTNLSKYLNEVKYPYLKSVEWTFPSIPNGHLNSWLLKKNLFISEILSRYSLDSLYPLQDFPVRTITNVKLVSWCTDFQYKYYPEFFSKKQIIGRNLRTKLALQNNNDLVLSSRDAYDDLIRFFKLRNELNIHIFHFVSVIDDPGNLIIDDLKEKYGLPERYFLVSNQFHKHKNHKVLLQALAKLKEKGIKKHLAITGKLPGVSDSIYVTELHKIIEENNLEDQMSLLGVISRNDQLSIMRYSQAVIQPSLFEGWSTVIEDAKSLQVPVIASNLKVNIEQLGGNGVYFDPNSPNELASILINYPERNLSDIIYGVYLDRVKEAAKTLIRIFK